MLNYQRVLYIPKFASEFENMTISFRNMLNHDIPRYQIAMW